LAINALSILGDLFRELEQRMLTGISNNAKWQMELAIFAENTRFDGELIRMNWG
jgi:hypothetical protein